MARSERAILADIIEETSKQKTLLEFIRSQASIKLGEMSIENNEDEIAHNEAIQNLALSSLDSLEKLSKFENEMMDRVIFEESMKNPERYAKRTIGNGNGKEEI